MRTWLKNIPLYVKYLRLRVENTRLKRHMDRQSKHIWCQCRIMEVRAIQLDKMSYHREANNIRQKLKQYIEHVGSDYQLGQLSAVMQWWTAHVTFKLFRKIKQYR